MRNLIAFIWKHYAFFTFLVLETICVILLVKNNNYHNAGFVNSANKVTGTIFSTVNNISQYFYLKEVNEQLAKENAMLHSLRVGSYVKLTDTAAVVNDQPYAQQYKYLTCRVVHNTVSKRNNYLTLDKGSRQGIKPETAVICPQGVVGIVKDVSENFSSVLSVLHKDSRISARIKNNKYFGSLVWEGNDYLIATLIHIPTHVKILKGDTIETSSYSEIFPEGIMIGRVEEFEIPAGQNFYNISVRLSTDFKSLTHVYVVTNLFKEEQRELEKRSQND